MLSDVEEKTYEFGMLRALGFNTKSIAFTIISQALTFAIPGLISGLVLSSIMNMAVRHMLYSITKNYASYSLSISAIWIGVFIGSVVPLASNVFPIQKALRKNLRASLDLYHRKVGELTISIQKLQDYGLSVQQFIMAIMLVVLGVCTYYVAPVAFLF